MDRCIVRSPASNTRTQSLQILYVKEKATLVVVRWYCWW